VAGSLLRKLSPVLGPRILLLSFCHLIRKQSLFNFKCREGTKDIVMPVIVFPSFRTGAWAVLLGAKKGQIPGHRMKIRAGSCIIWFLTGCLGPSDLLLTVHSCLWVVPQALGSPVTHTTVFLWTCVLCRSWLHNFPLNRDGATHRVNQLSWLTSD
jgi:hypothetical protein